MPGRRKSGGRSFRLGFNVGDILDLPGTPVIVTPLCSGSRVGSRVGEKLIRTLDYETPVQKRGEIRPGIHDSHVEPIPKPLRLDAPSLIFSNWTSSVESESRTHRVAIEFEVQHELTSRIWEIDSPEANGFATRVDFGRWVMFRTCYHVVRAAEKRNGHQAEEEPRSHDKFVVAFGWRLYPFAVTAATYLKSH
jgi:hypothetical protein